ncbi:NERD domain-containing protein [Psychrobacter sp. DAB_AL62B]|uniref:NERD domain-containing protein n=1 Tax=Psychrobacter sp. DAB_AL62B TaxID=1028420 RepID=UPI002380F4BB|nr:NERD domain-containing protein [Psychrobacter sp. DAB_AL62B]MDE4454879.1 DNA topoisomerase I [Psychrobacter sp. DAB_AL62B]
MSLMSSFKGVLGETVINVAMWLKLEKDVYHRLNNITLPLANGGSTQIDHVIVSVYGIFVIETKNYKGWIFGNEKQRQWTQVIMGRKYKFQNPLHQNYLHIKTLADLLELELNYFHSMIAFIGECELKTRDELPEHVLTSGIASYVKKKQDKLLTDEAVEAIVEQIESNRFNKSWKTNRQHKAYLKDKHSHSNKTSSKNPNTNSSNKSVTKPTPEPTNTEIVKSRGVFRWSGQTAVEHVDAAIVSASHDQPINSTNLANIQLTNEDMIFLTPFAVLEPEPKITEHSVIKQVDNPAVSPETPACPKCSGEMVKRVTKKGQRHGQRFYGCRQFPKCRGVMSID